MREITNAKSARRDSGKRADAASENAACNSKRLLSKRACEKLSATERTSPTSAHGLSREHHAMGLGRAGPAMGPCPAVEIETGLAFLVMESRVDRQGTCAGIEPQ